MNKFNIKVGRIERTKGRKKSGQVRVTFQVDGTSSFQVPIHLSVTDFDDTEMIRAARSVLHRTFAELSSQSRNWKLSVSDVQQLSNSSMRPKQ